MALFPSGNDANRRTLDRSEVPPAPASPTGPGGGPPGDHGEHASSPLRFNESTPQDALARSGFEPEEAEQDVSASGRGVHEVTKKTDYWFEREVGAIEKQAVTWARLWAEKGLPRHDVPRTEPLEPEQVLAKRCAQVFREWQLRVRTKMQDAIEEGSQQVGEDVATLRATVARLDTLGQELAEREGKIEKIRREIDAAEPTPVRYSPSVSNGVFWTCAILLVLVEFFTNFPIFRLLLPLDTALEQAAANAAANVDDTRWLAGLELFSRNLVWNVEAGLVAAVAVIVLVVLGKQLGKSLRPIVVLRESDYPLASRTIRAHRLQHKASLTISALGLVCVLAFLGVTRAHITRTAESRIAQDSVALRASQKSLDNANAANDRTGISAALTSQQGEEDALHRHQDAAAYARTVEVNNLSIFLLNVGLIATAAMLGFGNAHADLSDRQGEHPDLVKLRDRCAELRRDIVTVDADARTAVGRARSAIGHVQHLLRSHPLRGWESKMKRLEGAIPMFRGENARERGLDPANVRAFDEPATLDLPPLEEAASFAEPAEFGRLKDELEQLSARLGHLSARAAQRHPDLAIA